MMSSLDGRMRRTKLGAVRIAAAVRGVAVVSAERCRVRSMSRGEW